MKKLLLFLFAVFISQLLAAQTIVFHENFEFPSGGDSVINTADSAGFATAYFQPWSLSTQLAKSGVRSDSNKVQVGKTIYLTTNSFSTLGNNFVILEFSQICKLFFADGGQIEVSINNGTSWTTLSTAEYMGSGTLSLNKFSESSYSVDWKSGDTITTPTNSWWKNEKFDISSITANQANVKVRFKYYGSGNPAGSGRYGWLLDDVKVSVSPSELNPPSLVLASYPSDTVYTNGPYNISIYSNDASGVETVNLHYRYGNESFNNLLMTRSTTIDSLFTASIPFGGWGKKISYYVISTDSSSAHNMATLPSTGYKSFFCKFASGGLITIGTGTTTDKYLPIEPNYGYSYSQSLYNSSLIQSGGMINKISYYAVSSAGYGPDNFKLYMGNSSKTSFTSTSDWEPISNLTLVYDGSLTIPAGGGWVELTLTTPFSYNGLGNLVVAAYEFTSGYHSYSDDFYCTQYPNGGNVSLYYYDDYTNPNPAIPPTAISASNYIPNTKFEITASSSLTQDAGIAQIVNPAGGVTANAAFNVEAKIKNFGSSVLSKAIVKYAVDGNTPMVYNWTGSLDKDSVSTAFVAGNLNLSLGGHSLKLWSELPNDSLDMNNINDTAYISFYACASPLSGSYTLGGATADFATFADALVGLTQCGINGAVVFNVNAGTYSTQITIPEIFGASALNTITFKAANNDSTSVILNYNATAAINNWIVKLNGADNIIFKNINFAPANTTYSNAVVLTNGSTNNQFSGNLFSGNAGTTNDLASLRIEDIASDNNLIIGNQFNSGSMAIICKGASTSSLLSNITIKNNIISNFNNYGVFGEYVNKMVIDGNKITSDVSTTNKYGVYMHYAYDTVKVVRNNISLNGASNTYGILFDECHASDTTRGLIANNMISIINGTSYTYGIRTIYTDYQKIYFNSVIVNGTNQSDTRALNIATSSANIDILNNNLQSNRYPLHVEVNNAGKCNYNNYYATGSVFALWNNTAYANLQTLRTANQKDTNSLSVNPFFISLSNLHTFNGLLSGVGQSIAEITNDIDGDSRSTIPCIGADEFIAPANDATLISVITNNICGLTSTENVKVIIKNIGTSAISSANLTATYGFIGINNTLVDVITPENVNRTIAPGDTVNYTFTAKANLSVAATHIDSTYQIKAWVNLVGDYANANDSNQLATLSSYTPIAPTVSNFNCGYGSTVSLTAMSNDSLYWYDALTGGNFLYSGLNYTTVPLFSSTNYYVEAKASNPVNVQIGTGTSSQSYPFDIYYGYSRSASVYKASEIGGHGLINQLQFQVATTSTTSVPLKIYLKSASSETMSSENWASLTSGAVLVYDASLVFDQAGWKNISLTTPYNFATGNLMILCEGNYGGGGTGSYPKFNYTSTALSGTHQSTRQDNSAPTGNLSLNSSRPNVKIKIELAGCASPRVPILVTVAAPPPVDMGTTQIVAPIQSVPAAVSQAINVKVKNYGLLALTNANINYQIDNGTVNTYTWTATTPLAFNSTEIVTVANITFVPGMHTIKAWTSNPNNVQDTIAINDTISSSFLASLHGVYTLGDTTGGVQKDFPSFSAAAYTLAIAGVSEAVTFLVDTGSYTEQVRIPQIIGADAFKTITFRSANNDSTSVRLQFAATTSAANYTLKLDSADYFRFEKMTFKALGTTYGNVIEFGNGANYNVFSNNIIEMPVTTSSNYAGIYTNGSNNFNKIANNSIRNGYYGLYLNGASSSNMQIGNIVMNNKISDFYYYGIYSYNQDSIQIVKNNVNSITSNNSSYGIYAAYNNNSFLISKNTISLNSTSASSYGSIYGLYLYYCTGTSTKKGLSTNNIITIDGGTATASLYGFASYYSNYQNIYFNSVNMISAFTGSRAFYVPGGSDINVVNNNFVNTGGGFAYYSGSTSAVVASDYNNLFTTGSILGYYNYSNQNTISNWKSASNKDANSLSVDPLFVSNTDLHLISTAISAAAIPMAEVTDDIDGQIRNLIAPTIGAVEFPLYQFDAGVIAILSPVVADTEAAVIPVRVIVKNFGTDTITTMPVYYKVNNGTPVAFTYNGSIASLHVDTVTLPNLILPAGNNTICAYTALLGDINLINNQTCKNFFGMPLFDAQLTQVSPINGGCNLTTDSVKVWIKNKGINIINAGLSASYKRIGEAAVITEIVSTTINPGDSSLYTFNAPVNLAVTTQDSNFHIKAWVTLLQDNNHANDTVISDVKSLHTPGNPLVNNISIPYGTSANLLATSLTNDPLYWYDTLVGGTSIHNSGNYITPYLFATDTFFVEARTGFSANITLGNGTVTQGYPFYSYYMDSRSEMLYKATELTAQNLIAGTITSLAFDIASADAAVLNGFTIKMQNFAPNTVSGFHSTGWQTVYSSNYTVPATGWQAIQLQTPFYWDGVSNILLSVCFDNSGYTSNSTVNTSNVPDCVYHDHDDLSTGNGCNDLTTGSVYADRPNIKFIANVAGCGSQRISAIVNVGPQSPKDAGIIAIVSPSTAVNLTNNETVTVKIKNFGSTAISNFSVKYKVGNNTVVSQIVTDTINANDTLIKSFIQTANLSSNMQPQTFVITAWTSLTNDATVLNDTAKKSVINNLPIYCPSTASYAGDEDLGNVTFAGINNGISTPVTNNPAANQMYNDYTALPAASIQPGMSYPISVGVIFSYGGYTGKCNVYIDYNRNGNWDLPEELAFTSVYDGATNSTVTGNVVVPYTAIPGFTRMRVVVDEADVAPACGTYGYGETEDYNVNIIPPIPHDAGITTITNIGSYLPFNAPASQVAKFVIRNFGSDTLSNAIVKYNINGTINTYNWSKLPALQSLESDTFMISNITIQQGMNLIDAYTLLNGDTNYMNDTVHKKIFKESMYSMPFADNFDMNSVWFATDTNALAPINNLWEQGVPTASVINMAHTATNVWATNLDGNYVGNNISILYSPKFNMGTMTADTLKFWQWRNFGTGAYGRIEYLNNVSGWSVLGSVNDPNAGNWYTNANGFDTISNGWVLSTYKLNNLTNVANVTQFRFVFTSAATTTPLNGWAIDDFSLSLAPLAQDGGVIAIATPGNLSLVGDTVYPKVTIKNFGTAPLTSVPVKYQVSGQGVVAANWNGNLLPGSTVDFTFPTKFVVNTTNYSICAFTAVTGDIYTQNDTTCKAVTVNPALFDVAVTEIITPGDTAVSGTTAFVKVRIKNFGSTALTSIPVVFQRGSGTPVAETWTGAALNTGDEVVYTFTSTFTVAMGSQFSLCAYTNLTNDAYPQNNKICKSVIIGSVGIDDKDADKFWMTQNMPNPTNAITNIEFGLPTNGEVIFNLVNMIGQHVYTETTRKDAGRHQIQLNVTDFPNGVYYYAIEFKGKRLVKKMLITK